MRSHTGARLAARAAGILLCLAASCLPAAAARHTLTAGDGSTVLVWEQKGRSMRGRPGAVWAIGFSVTDASGTHVGVVAPTGDTARDSSPFLALDDAGAPVLVWSRFDGVYNKIAYTRYAGGDWTDFHYLTFGSGDDLLPLIATTASGSYLFYTGSSDRYFFAPLDLASGRLFAPPRRCADQQQGLQGRQDLHQRGHEATAIVRHPDHAGRGRRSDRQRQGSDLGCGVRGRLQPRRPHHALGECQDGGRRRLPQRHGQGPSAPRNSRPAGRQLRGHPGRVLSRRPLQLTGTRGAQW